MKMHLHLIKGAYLKYVLPVILLFSLQTGAFAQDIYRSNNSAEAKGTALGVEVKDFSNSGTTIVKTNDGSTPIIFPMIGLAKTASASTVKTDGSYDVTYTMMIRNYAGVALNTIQVTDDLAATFPAPATFTMVGVVTKMAGVADGTGAINVNTAFNGTTDKNLLLPGTSSLIAVPTPASGDAYYASIQFTVNVKPNGAFVTYNNTATVTAKTVTADPADVSDVSHNHASPNEGSTTLSPVTYNTPTPVSFPPSDIEVNKSVDNPTPNVNANVVFTVKVKNNGTGTAAPVVVNDLLPAGYQYVSHVAPGTTTYSGVTGVWSVGTLIVGAAAEQTLTITAKVLPSKTAAEYTNIASSSHPGDPVPANNTSTVNTVVPVQIADLKISNSDGKTPYVPGTTNTYTVVVTNDGPSDVTGATVTNTLPAGVTGTWTAVYAGGATGTATGTNSISELVNMPSGSTVTYTYVVSVPSSTTGNFTNTATVAAPVGITDPTPANNSATDIDSQNSIADLKISNTDGKTAYVPGTTNTYTVVVTNDGPSNVTGATVTNTLPVGVTGIWTAVYAGGATGTANGTNSISELVTMPSGSTVTYTYVVSVPSGTTGNFVNTATVAAPVGVTDPTPANNTATDTDTQDSQADLKISNTDGKTAYIPGTTNTYTVVVTNDGPSNVTGATVTNTLPVGVTGTWTAVYAGGATGTANGTNSISELVTMPSGSTVTYTYVVSVPSGTTGNFVNTATVAAPVGVTDPTPANNTATDTDTQNSTADLKISNTDGKTAYVPGTTNTYTVVVTNDGPSNVTGATVTNTLPVGVTGTWTAVYAGGATGTANGTNSISELVTMPSGSTVTYTYVVTIPSSTTGSFVNTATVAAPVGVTDPTPANNTAADTDTQNSTADLKISNTDGKTAYVPGTTNTYTVVVTNDGPSDVTGATVTNTLPVGVTGTWTAVYAGGATGTANGTNSISELVTMPSGSTVTYTYVVSVPSGTTGNFVNTATVAAPVGVADPTPANNTATDTDTQDSQADLKISNTDGKTAYIPGTTNTYTVVVTNDGPSDVTGATVTNTLPVGVTGTWTAVYAGGATGTANGTNSISELVTMPSGSAVTYTYVVSIPSGTTGSFVNTATVAVPAGVTDPTPANNTATDTDTQNSTADLKISNTDGKTAYVPGTTNTYTVVVTNDGPSNVTGATVTNTLPVGVTGTWTAVYAGGATGTTNGTNNISELVTMPSGSTVTYTYVVTIPSSTTGSFVNTATVAAPVGVTDPTPANNTAADTDTQNSIADLKISNTDGKTAYVPGTTNTYTVVVTNDGPSNVTGATVTNTLPTGVTGTWTAVYAGGATGTANGTNSISELVTMPSGSTVTYTYVVSIPSNTTGSFINTATVGAPLGVTDPTPANNTATDTDTQNSIADLKISDTDGKTAYVPGTTNTYTVVVTNDGPSDVTGATVTNTLPTGVTGTWTAVYAGGATGTANGTNSISELVSMPGGSTVTYTYVVNVPSNTTGSFVNTATVAAPAGITDPTPANNSATDTDTQNSIADLRITNTDGKTAYVPGTTNTYTVVVTNDGPTDVTGATVKYTLPAGITGTWTAVYSTNANGTASGTTSGTGSISELVNLPAGTTVTYTFIATIPASYQNDLVVPATVALPGGVADPTPTNNSAVDTDTQNVLADLRITNTDGKTTYTPGTTNTYTIVATNEGPSNVAGALITNTLPTGVTGTWTAVYAGGATGTASGTNSISQLVNIPVGGTVTYTYTVNVPSGTTAGFINTATIAAPTGVTDPTPANNTATDTDTQSSLTDLAVTETVDNTTPDAGGTVTFTVTARNNGPSDATGVKMTDILPAGFTFVSAQPSAGTYDSATGIWTMSGLTSGATATLNLTVKVNPNVPPSGYINPVTISGNETESTLMNNNDSKTITPVPLIDLAIVKTVSNANPDAGSTITFTVAVRNDGPSHATGVLVNDLLKPGYSFVSAATANGTYTSGTGVWAIGNLAAGSTATLTLSVYVNPTGPYDNTATVSGTEKEINLANNSSGVVPPVNAHPTIGLAKNTVSAVKQLNGSYDITYVFTVGNYGLVDMDKIAITDDLSKTFTGQIVTVKSVKSLGALKINPAFNGTTNIQLLEANTNKLAKGQVEKLEILINVLLVDNDGTFMNSAFAEGYSVAGLKAEDQSTDGVAPDPVTPGNVSPSAPTPVTLVRNKELIPEGFSPNGDGVNDKFVIENLGLNKVDLQIYNRWGNLVYKNPDYKNDWDGTCNTGIYLGQNLPDGTYYYVAIIDGKERRVRFFTINR